MHNLEDWSHSSQLEQKEKLKPQLHRPLEVVNLLSRYRFSIGGRNNLHTDLSHLRVVNEKSNYVHLGNKTLNHRTHVSLGFPELDILESSLITEKYFNKVEIIFTNPYFGGCRGKQKGEKKTMV